MPRSRDLERTDSRRQFVSKLRRPAEALEREEAGRGRAPAHSRGCRLQHRTRTGGGSERTGVSTPLEGARVNSRKRVVLVAPFSEFD